MEVKRSKKQKRKVQKPRVSGGGSGVVNTTVGRLDNRTDQVIMFQDVIPPRLVTRLKYIVNTSLYNAGLNVASKQLNANGVYDVDPALASTAVPGFTEFAALYYKYRVLKTCSKCTFVNRETFPMLVNIGFENTFFTANTKTKSFFDGKAQKTQIIPQSQTARGVTLSMTRTVNEMVGDQEGDTSANWANFVTGNPAALYFCSAAADCSTTGNVFAAGGVAIRWEVEFWTEFYNPKLFTT